MCCLRPGFKDPLLHYNIAQICFFPKAHQSGNNHEPIAGLIHHGTIQKDTERLGWIKEINICFLFVTFRSFVWFQCVFNRIRSIAEFPIKIR